MLLLLLLLLLLMLLLLLLFQSFFKETKKVLSAKRGKQAEGRNGFSSSLSLLPILFNLTSGSTARDLATTLASSSVAKVTRASLLCFGFGLRKEEVGVEKRRRVLSDENDGQAGDRECQ